MTFFKRMFSGDYRRAVAAEAAGEYGEAARAYALAGERIKVAEMHLLRAERATNPSAKLQELRAAVPWTDLVEPEGRQARRRIARGLYQCAKGSALVGDGERQVVREAAAMLSEIGDFAAAGECLEFIHEEGAAAEAYQRGGDLDRLEAVLAREEQRRKLGSHIHDAFAEYRLALAAGERDRALEAIRRAAEAPLPAIPTSRESTELVRDRSGYERLCQELDAKLITSGTLALTLGRSDQAPARRYIGTFPLLLGRDPSCHLVLRDVGISRQHAEIVRDPGGGFAVRDRGSKNGSTLGGLPIDGTLPLVGAGQLGLGDVCVIDFTVEGERLHLAVARGLDRGLEALAGTVPLPVDAVGEVEFLDGRPRLSALGGRLLYLNGVHTANTVQLIHGDLVELSEARIEVL